MGICVQEVLSRGKKCTYAGQVTCIQIDDSEVTKACFREDNSGDNKHASRDKSSYSVGEYMLEHDSRVVCAECSRNQNIFLILESVELHSCSARHSRPTGKEEGNKQD